MYITQEIEHEPRFMEIKKDVKSSVISLCSTQLIFQIFTQLYIQMMSYFPTTENFTFLSPLGLNSFAWDMWLAIILLIFSLISYSALKKVKDFPLYLLISYPATLLIFSLVRDVSLLQVATFSLLSCALVLQVNFQRVKQLQLSKY